MGMGWLWRQDVCEVVLIFGLWYDLDFTQKRWRASIVFFGWLLNGVILNDHLHDVNSLRLLKVYRFFSVSAAVFV